jgi:hypothetical protein
MSRRYFKSCTSRQQQLNGVIDEIWREQKDTCFAPMSDEVNYLGGNECSLEQRERSMQCEVIINARSHKNAQRLDCSACVFLWFFVAQPLALIP